MTETAPIFQLTRPVLNDLTKPMNKLQNEVEQRGVAKYARRLGDKAMGVVILSRGEIGQLAMQHDIEITEDLVDQLAGYLEDHLPDTSDNEVTVPTYPVTIHEPLGREHQRLFTVASHNPIVEDERRTAKLLTEEFFGVDEMDNHWPDWHYFSYVQIIRTSSQDAAKHVSQYLLQNSGLFTPTITLGPVEIRPESYSK